MNIVTFYQSTAEHLDMMRDAAPSATIVAADHESLSDQMAEADVFFGHVKAPVDWKRVVRAGRLKWIQSSAAGMDHCLVGPICDSKIVVSSASGVFANQVAEQTLALLLALIRRLHIFIPAMSKRSYVRQPTDDLHGKQIGIIGVGGNGQRIARLLEPFGCPILATDCFDQQELPGIDRVYPPAQLQEVLSQSDVVILTVPLTSSTRNMIGAGQLSTMPKGSYLINVARGGVIDQDSLIESLISGHLAGAGLDVAAIEPLPAESRLWELDNVVITPHVGAQSRTRNDDVTKLFCENLRRFAAGLRLINQVDKSVGFPAPADRFRGPNATRK